VRWACWGESPASPPPGAICRRDRGCQYTSGEFRALVGFPDMEARAMFFSDPEGNRLDFEAGTPILFSE